MPANGINGGISTAKSSFADCLREMRPGARFFNADEAAYVVVQVLFFFSSRRRHTRFDCDWSSDVCSSDLPTALLVARERPERLGLSRVMNPGAYADTAMLTRLQQFDPARTPVIFVHGLQRSGERRGGEECRSPWSPDHLKKKKIKRVDAT